MTALAVYQRLLAVATAQAAAVEAEDLAGLHTLSDEREALMAQLQPPAEPAAHAIAVRVLEAIVALDARARAALQTSLHATRAELGQLHHGQRAVHAYSPRGTAQGIGGRA